jgi:purine catabolism regulator
MAKAKAISETRKALQGNFLEGLLAGTLQPQEIQRLAGRLEHNANSWHGILTFAWDGENPPSLRRLETPINWLLSSHRIQALTHIYGDEHLCVFQALNPEDQEMSSAIELANHILEHVKVEFPNTRLLSGLSGPAETLADWPTVHAQAVQAMRLGKRLNKETLIRYNSVGIFQLLAQLEDQPALRKFCDQVAGPLVNYDKQHRSSLVETLNAFFNHHGNVSQTADALYIHRNTLLYRLERIQDLTGQDLDQADNRLALHLALRLWQLRPGREDEG